MLKEEKDPKVCFDWQEWIPKIEEVDRKNSVLEIDLPQWEWERLRGENLASLKSRLPPTAAGRLILLHGDSLNPNRYYLLVAHIGSCFHR